MFPVLPFIAGIAVGASALSLARKAKARPHVSETAAKARQKLRQTAIASLDAVHHASGQWRDRIASEKTPETSCCCAPKDDAPAADADQPERKPRAKKSAE